MYYGTSPAADVSTASRMPPALADDGLLPAWFGRTDQVRIGHDLKQLLTKYDGDLGRPNCYSPLPADICARKVSLLMECFGTQRSRQWFDEDTFRGWLRVMYLDAFVSMMRPHGIVETALRLAMNRYDSRNGVTTFRNDRAGAVVRLGAATIEA